ncbi:MAG: hypothetical protein IAE79_17145 [Anaerolinea sp.]|nr:hypothetical protein [Anaerolinea sp.]
MLANGIKNINESYTSLFSDCPIQYNSGFAINMGVPPDLSVITDKYNRATRSYSGCNFLLSCQAYFDRFTVAISINLALTRHYAAKLILDGVVQAISQPDLGLQIAS